MKKIAAFCLLVLLPLVAKAGYVFELPELSSTVVFLANPFAVDKEVIKYIVTVKEKNSEGKSIIKDEYLRVVRHEDVNEEVLNQLAETYGAKIRVSAKEEYGIGTLNNDDIVILSDKNITVANCDITTTGNIHIRANMQVTIVLSNIKCDGNLTVDYKDSDLDSLSLYLFGSFMEGKGVKVKTNDLMVYHLKHRKITDFMGAKINKEL